MITIYRALNPADAQLVRARLEAAGFHAAITDELATLSLEGYSLASGGIRVRVPESEAEEARAFLDSSEETDS